jgi:hypothetical protein
MLEQYAWKPSVDAPLQAYAWKGASVLRERMLVGGLKFQVCRRSSLVSNLGTKMILLQ